MQKLGPYSGIHAGAADWGNGEDATAKLLWRGNFPPVLGDVSFGFVSYVISELVTEGRLFMPCVTPSGDQVNYFFVPYFVTYYTWPFMVTVILGAYFKSKEAQIVPQRMPS